MAGPRFFGDDNASSKVFTVETPLHVIDTVLSCFGRIFLKIHYADPSIARCRT